MAKIVIEIRKQPQIGSKRFEIAEIQPLPTEIAYQGLRARVRQHSPHLLFKHVTLAKFTAFCNAQQLLIWNAAPEEKRKPACQVDVADSVHRLTGLIVFDTKKKLRADENCAQGTLEAGFKIFFRPVELHRFREVRICHRPPVRASH